MPPSAANKIRTPLIAECPVALECRTIQHLTLGAHDLFIGEVLAVQIDEEVLSSRGQLDYERAQPLAYAGGYYLEVGKRLGRYGDWRAGAE